MLTSYTTLVAADIVRAHHDRARHGRLVKEALAARPHATRRSSAVAQMLRSLGARAAAHRGAGPVASRAVAR